MMWNIAAGVSSGLNLVGANQHLSTAVWGMFLIAVMIQRWLAATYRGSILKKE